MGPAAQETRPVNNICLTTFQWSDEVVVVIGIVFQVRVLDDHVVASRLLNPAA